VSVHWGVQKSLQKILLATEQAPSCCGH